jgi:hypothetical protein
MKIIEKIIKFYHNLPATLKGVLRFFYFHILNKLPNLAKTFLWMITTLSSTTKLEKKKKKSIGRNTYFWEGKLFSLGNLWSF